MITYKLTFRNINGKVCEEILCTVYDDPDDEATLKEYDDGARKRYREWRKNSFHCTDMKVKRCLPIGFEKSPWHNVTIAANEA